jgi:DNA polymerase-3 subunit delta
VAAKPDRKPPDKPVYLLTGSDRPKIEGALVRLREHFAPEATDLRSALDTSAEAVVALCNAGSLFGDARLVVVEDVDGRRDSDGRLKGGWKAADADAVSTYLGSPAPATVLALVGEDVKKTTALWKACAKAGDILEFAVQKKDVQRWVADQFRQRGIPVEPEACAALVQIVGDDLHALSLEVDKLATWAAGEPIGEREVEQLAAAAADAPIFTLTDAWAVRDAPRALAASETIFERESKPRRDTAARLAGALGSHLSRLASIKRLAADGVRSKEAAGKLRMHPFYAEKLYRQAEAFSPEELGDAVVRLAELDGALKGQSRLAPDLEVQRALVDLTRPLVRKAGTPR